MLDVGKTLKDKKILFVGATGFVGKVALSMLLERYPELGKVYVLVRPGAGSSSEERFFRKIVKSPVFDPIRAKWGSETDAFLRDKVAPLAGDAARKNLNFTDADFERFGKLDLLINCAGLVSFTPALDTAMRINTMGPVHALDVARKTGSALVHISTCFVAGNRNGEVWEDEPVHGYYPRRGELRDEDFDVDAEIADCNRIIEQVKARADDRAHVSMFRDRAAKRLKEEGRDADDEATLKLAVARERKIWVATRLTELGMERAQHWGWPNIYTYTKSLGEQVLAKQQEVRACIVRPSIVETSLSYPFRGWNEGFTTTAPMAFIILKGQRSFVASKKANNDMVPVDLVAAGIIAASAATIAGVNKLVYQCATSDVVPCSPARAVELTSLYARKHWQDKETGNKVLNRLRARLESVPVSKRRFQTSSVPAFKLLSGKAIDLLDEHAPSWGAPRISAWVARARQKLDEVHQLSSQASDLFELFLPFIHDNEYVFRCDNVRELFASLTEEDRAKLVWNPEVIDWREYWMENHLPALKKWIFPDLEEEFKAKSKPVYQYKNLVEMFDATTKLHKSRTAMRLLPPVDSDEPVLRYSYQDLRDYADRGAAVLAERGVGPGDRVLLMSENRPEWGLTFFSVLKAGGVVVPMDEKATLDEVVNVLRRSQAKVCVLSDRVRERLEGLHERAAVPRLGFDEILLVEPRKALGGAPLHQAKGDELASLIFTSGTTGNPKGVMLSHRNFTALLSKLCTVFDLSEHDRLLSVLPLHHTFEFTAGLLMPLTRGAQISYMHEVTPEALAEALEQRDVTGMIGVPALWQLLHRKIKKNVAERGPWVEEIFDAVVDASRILRDKSGINIGKFIFWPIQRKLGGRVRLLVSGGSALPPEVMKAFQGLGFSMFEGYGLTEASPVLAVARPGTKVIPGSVGEALPGIELKIDNPDANGVGEVVASGPNVMMGYYEDPDATAEVIKDGWLHTGDLGKLDEEKRLFIVGRKKEMILAANGENVYPDELEDLYAASPWIKELSIVGLPEEDGVGEMVACLVVPDYEKTAASGEPLTRAEVREKVSEHFRETSLKLPHFKRVKVMHLWDLELPRTATRKVKRRLVVEELKKLMRAAARASEAVEKVERVGGGGGGASEWVLDVVAATCQKPREKVTAEARLAELGFDSLMFSELGVALEAAGVDVPEADDLQQIETVADLVKWVEARPRRKKAPATAAKSERARDAGGAGDDLNVPKPVVEIGWKVLRAGQRAIYERIFDTKVTGTAHLPGMGPFIVAANHASHLDMGLVKHALGDWGPHLVALAAKDYFFEDRLYRAYFENFTNLIPMDRHGSLRESLRLASSVLKEGHVLLIFPEGTRSEDGVLKEFKPSVGYLALANKVDVLPMYLEGTYDALPKGATLPKQRNIAAHMGPVLKWQSLRAAVESLPKGEQYREASRVVENAVRRLGKLPPVGRVTPPPSSEPGAESAEGSAS